MERKILLNPGPATTRDTVKNAQIVPDICPREKEFVKLMKEIREDLVKIVHGNSEEYTSVLFCGSGTICMDICLNSLLPADKKILVVNNGAYSAPFHQPCTICIGYISKVIYTGAGKSSPLWMRRQEPGKQERYYLFQFYYVILYYIDLLKACF